MYFVYTILFIILLWLTGKGALYLGMPAVVGELLWIPSWIKIATNKFLKHDSKAFGEELGENYSGIYDVWVKFAYKSDQNILKMNISGFTAALKSAFSITIDTNSYLQKHIWRKFDTKNEKEITYFDFCGIISLLLFCNIYKVENSLIIWFEMFDNEQKGFISYNEFKQILKSEYKMRSIILHNKMYCYDISKNIDSIMHRRSPLISNISFSDFMKIMKPLLFIIQTTETPNKERIEPVPNQKEEPIESNINVDDEVCFNFDFVPPPNHVYVSTTKFINEQYTGSAPDPQSAQLEYEIFNKN